MGIEEEGRVFQLIICSSAHILYSRMVFGTGSRYIILAEMPYLGYYCKPCSLYLLPFGLAEVSKARQLSGHHL